MHLKSQHLLGAMAFKFCGKQVVNGTYGRGRLINQLKTLVFKRKTPTMQWKTKTSVIKECLTKLNLTISEKNSIVFQDTC